MLSSRAQRCRTPQRGGLPYTSGAADTYVAVAYTTIQEIVDYVIATHEDIADDAEIGRL